MKNAIKSKKIIGAASENPLLFKGVGLVMLVFIPEYTVVNKNLMKRI